MELEDQRLFERIELAEPSAEVDQRILATARARPLAPLRGTLIPRLALAGALAAASVALVLIPWMGKSGREGEGPAWGPEAPLDALASLRDDLDQIGEMAELVEGQQERETIALRVRACLRDLEKLEVRLKGESETSLFIESESPGKGVNL